MMKTLMSIENMPEFFLPIGIEFSFIPSAKLRREEKKRTPWGSYSNKDEVTWYTLHKIFKKEKIKGNVHDDDGIVEVASPIFRKWENCLSYYRKIDIITKENGYKKFSDLECNGGGHIHISLPKLGFFETSRFIRNIYVFISQFPFLSWIFNEPEDNRNSISFLSKNPWAIGRYDYDGRKFISDHIDKSHINIESLANITGSKKYAIRFDSEYQTIEFRFFDMPKNEIELYLQVLFAQKVVKHVKESYHISMRSDLEVCLNFFKKDSKRCEKSFLNLLSLLEIDDNLQSLYKKTYFKKLKKRFSYGEKYLI